MVSLQGNDSSSDSSCESITLDSVHIEIGDLEDTSMGSCNSDVNSSCDEDQDTSDTDDDQITSDLECFEAHFLEERPETPEPNNLGPEPDGDPDDPDDFDNDEDDVDPADSDDDEDSDEEVANFENNALNVPLRMRNNDLTKGQIILIELATAIRHSNTFERLLDAFRNLNVTFGRVFFPTSKTKLWDLIQLNKAGIQFHVYCSKKLCGRYLCRRERLVDYIDCECGFRVHASKAKFFVTLNLIHQLKQFLSIPGIWEKLQYRYTRQKRSATGIEDIFDSAEYIRLMQDGGLLASRFNFSYVFNLDGCRTSKKGALKMWPVYIRLNDLPPEMRQKFYFLAGVYVDYVDPNFQAFMRPFVKQANRLSTTGINWKPNGVDEVNSKFIPLCHCVDTPARCGILHMSSFSTDFGCTYCTHTLMNF